MRTTNINKGDQVYGSFGRYGDLDVRIGTVASKSPNGTVQVTFGNRTVSFKPDGFERGTDAWSGGHLIDREQYDAILPRMMIQRAERHAGKLIRDAANVTITQANRDDVIAKLEAALTAARAIADKA